MCFKNALYLAIVISWARPAWSAEPTEAEVTAAMKKAATFFREKVALRGGYVYYYSEDLKDRWGEGEASPTQIWVQPPGTPAVGEAYLAAYRATRDDYFLDAAKEAAEALVAGQLQSGGWSNKIDFDPASKDCGLFRNGKGNPKGRNFSTLDDNASQSAFCFLTRCDNALNHKQTEIHEAAMYAQERVLQAQYPNGGFPQVWSGPVPAHPIVRANYPDYNWRTENRVNEYWNVYTLNDGLCRDMIPALLIASDWKKPWDQIKKLGDFLILAQMPEPQPAWAQQYNFEMQPAWARKFEPPAIAGRESEDAIETLLEIASWTRDRKYLEPLPAALAYLKKSELPDGQLARFYELRTNKPLYMTRDYESTYRDDNLPTHYSFKTKSHVDELQNRYDYVRQNLETFKGPWPEDWPEKSLRPIAKDMTPLVASLDEEGRWVSVYDGESLTGHPRFSAGQKYISSAVFSANLEKMSRWLAHRLGR